MGLEADTFFPTTAWDGSSRSRPNADGQVLTVHRPPDAYDHAQVTAEIIAMQTRLGLGPAYVAVAYAATIAMTPSLGATQKIGQLTGDLTINVAAVGPAGSQLRIILPSDGSVRTTTFGTGFKPATSTLASTGNKTATVTFVSDGTNYYETSRITGIT